MITVAFTDGLGQEHRGKLVSAAMDASGNWWVLVACDDGVFRDVPYLTLSVA